MRTPVCGVWLVMLLICLPAFCGRGQSPAPVRELVQSRVAQEYPSLFELYKHLHSHPELSFHETQSAARVAEELRQAGCEVTAGVGKGGVVAVLRNGNGPTVLLRADMDALPVKEQTGKSLPSLRSPLWAPVPEPSIKSGVTTFVAWVLELLGNPKP